MTVQDQNLIQKMIVRAIQDYDKSRFSFRSNIRKAPARDTKTIGSNNYQYSVTGSRGANAALASLLTQLAKTGIIVDNSS